MITLKLDKRGGINKGDVQAFEHDNLSEVYIIQLYKNGEVYSLTNKTVELIMLERKRKLGDIFDLPIYEATEGKVKLGIVTELTKQDGLYDFQITVKDTTGLIETFPHFQIDIKRDLVDDIAGGIIEDPNFTILTEGLKTLADYNIYKTNALKVPEIEKNIVDLTSQLDTIAIQVTPRMTNNNLQEAVDLAVTLGVNKLVLEKKTYNLSDTLYLPSNFILEGVKGESIISMQGVNKPVVSKKGSIGGNTHIKNITIIGDKTQSENDGIYFNDYYSSIEDCTIRNCGRHGVYFANGIASSTLVENKFKSLVFRDCMGYAFYSDEGNKCTDATLEDILVNGTTGVLGGIRIGSGAGWFISKVHTYNFNSVCPFDIRNSFNTNIDNIYIENSGGVAIGLYQVQQTCNINNITIMRSTNMKTGIYLNKSTSTSYSAVVNISNCNIVNNIDSDFTMINSDGSDVGVKTSNLSVQGTKKSIVKLIGDNIKPGASYIDNAQIDGTLRGKDSKLYLDNTKFLPYLTKKWSGSGEQTIVLQLSNITAYCKIPFLITLFAQKWDTQGGQVKFSASGLISCGSSVSSNAITSLELGTSIGLTTTPKYSLNGETQELTITFTPSATDGSNQGILYMQFGY